MSGFTGPKDMDGILQNAINTLRSVEHNPSFPQDKILNCSGIALLNSKEIGIGVTAQDSSGVMLARSNKGGVWSPPLPIASTGLGVGSLGYAEKKTIIVLNQAAVNSIVVGSGSPIKFGTSAGIANDKIGEEVRAGGGVGVAGLESSYAFSVTEGGIVSLEIHGCVIKPMEKVISAYYPGKTTADILEGKVDIPKDSKAAELMANVSTLTKP